MSKKWKIKIDDKLYDIEYKNKLIINGEQFKMKQFKKKTKLLTAEYNVPIGSKMALLECGNFNSVHLIIDGKDCATGEEYIPMKLPAWSYIFMFLHFINILNGAFGMFLAILGFTLTAAVSCNQKMNLFVKIILNIIIVVLSAMVIFSIAFTANHLIR